MGSMLLGSKAFIERARSVRKALGGGMRQAGILAAAGLIALEKMPPRLKEDHANARFLAEVWHGFRASRLIRRKSSLIFLFLTSPEPG